MKILIVSASPKKHFSTSAYFSQVLKLWLTGHQVSVIQLRSIQDYNKILEKLPAVDALVFAFPVYVDAIPSTVLDYLYKLQQDCMNNHFKLKVYSIHPCGFYEGHQCGLTLDMLKNFCIRSNMEWGGGIGIGAGEMLSIIRINIPIAILIELIKLVIHSFSLVAQNSLAFTTLLSSISPESILKDMIIYLAYSLGMFIGLFRLRNRILLNKIGPNIFTTVWFCPRFLFVWMASIYWGVRALICHRVPIWRLFKKVTPP